MNVYSYYDKIVDMCLPENCDKSRVIYKDNKVIIKRFSEVDEKYFDVNVKNYKKEKVLTFNDFNYLHTTVISKKNNKILLNQIFHQFANTRCNKLYYLSRKKFLSFSNKGVTTNELGGGIKKIPYFGNNYFNYKYRFYFKDLFLYHHPDKEWALDLYDYQDFDYRIKNIIKHNSLTSFLKDNCAKKHINWWS